ncbi:MAG: dUTP diphosphatase [Candidatus Aminicenantales bacterium]
MNLRVKRLSPQAKLPSYGHPDDAGLDLYSSEETVIRPGEVKAVPTGLKIAIPPGFVGLIWDKSGLALRGVHRLAGVVDSGYRGEVRVVLVNLGQENFEIGAGMKIAQMLVQPVEQVVIEEVEELDPTPRGEAGFGSTGRY